LLKFIIFCVSAFQKRCFSFIQQTFITGNMIFSAKKTIFVTNKCKCKTLRKIILILSVFSSLSSFFRASWSFKRFSGAEISGTQPYRNCRFRFFVVSGFLIARSYESSSSLKSYISKRIRRIVPAYLLVVFLCAILLSLVSTYSFREYFSNTQVYKYLFWNSIFLNFKAPWLPEFSEIRQSTELFGH
jgi:hypothetical protein